MLSKKSINCTDGFKKTLRMSKFLGIMPLDEQCHLKPTLVVASTLIYSFQLAFISFWFWLYYISLLKLDINTFFIFFRICCSVVSLALISYRFGQKRQQLRAVMWSLTAIDELLSSSNLPWEWSIRPVISGGDLIMIIFPFVTNALFAEQQKFLWPIMFYTDMLLILLGMNQFYTFLNLIEYCLKQIGCSKNLESFPKLYSVIECFWQVLNEIYGPGITCIIVALYLGVLQILFNFFSAAKVELIIYINGITLAAMYWIIMLQIILTCNKLSAQVKKFNMDLLNEQKHSRKLLDSEELQFHFETMEEFEFTAYNFFPVNISLLGSMILSETTYLVTLFQLSPSSIQKSE